MTPCDIRLTTRNLNEFMEALKTNEPLFHIDATLSIPEIILRPSGSEVYNIILQVVQDFLERYNLQRTNLFIRCWTGIFSRKRSCERKTY